MSKCASKDVEKGIEMLSKIKEAKNEGLGEERYDEKMEPGLTERQREVAEKYSGEGEIPLNHPSSTSENNISKPDRYDEVEEGEKLPWVFVLDGVEFVVKTEVGDERDSSTLWYWVEDGYYFTIHEREGDEGPLYSVSVRRQGS